MRHFPPLSLPQLVAASLLSLTAAFAQPAGADDQKSLIKAAFIYNFARFTDWPADSFTGARSSVRVCHWRDDPLGRALATIDDKQVGPRAIEVIALDRSAALPANCHIAVLDGPQVDGSAPVMRGLLTVADVRDLSQTGVAVGLVQIGRQVRFQVNTAMIARADLRMSSKLLRLAAKVVQ